MIEFAALPMLISLAAAAIPYLLLRNRLRTKKTIYWSANRLLEQAAKLQARKMDWLRWLLLALRTLALVCLALAVANPFWKLAGSRASSLDTNATLHCYVIDTSPSMTLKESDLLDSPTRLMNAVRSLRDEVSGLGSHDLIGVVTLGDSAQMRFLGDRSATALDRTLNDIVGSAVSANSIGLDAAIQQVIDQARDRNRSLQNVSVKIISDFSMHDWSTDQLTQFREQIASRDDGLSIHTEFVLAPQHGTTGSVPTSELSPIRNLSLCKLSFTDASESDSTGRLIAEINNSGTIPTAAISVQLWIANQLDSTVELPALAAGETTSVEFKLNRHTDSDLKLEVRLPEDQLTMDNVAFHVLERSLSTTGLLIGSDDSATLGLSAAYESLGAPASTRATIDAFSESTTVQDIHIVDPVVMDGPLLQRLSHLAADGNHIYVWMGNRLPVSALEQIDTIDVPARRFAITNWATTDLATIVDTRPPKADTSPSAFAIPLSTYWALDTIHTGWQTILELGSGQSFAVQRSVGGGSLTWIVTPPLLTATTEITPANESAQVWNAMARWPSFIPLVDFLRSTAARSIERNYFAGEDIRFFATPNDSLTLQRPDLTNTIQYIGPQDKLTIKADQLGWYSLVSSKNATVPAMSFAANLDCREIEFHSIEMPPDAQSDSSKASNLGDHDFTKRPLFRVLLVVCLSFLVIEMVVTSAVALRRV